MLRGNSTESKRPSGRRPKMSISGLMRQLTDKPFEEEIKMKYPNIVNQLGFKEAGEIALGDLVLVEESSMFVRSTNAIIGGAPILGFSGGNFRAVTSVALDGKNNVLMSGGNPHSACEDREWAMTVEANQDVLVLRIEDKNDWDGYAEMNMTN